jgi:hypothetical protein
MKVFLVNRDQDIDLDRPPPPNECALSQDLELETLLRAMAAGDEFLFDIVRRVVLASVPDPDGIVYRQRVLEDCLANSSILRQMYDIAVEALQSERKVWFGILLRDSPDTILRRSVQVLELLVAKLKQLRQVTDDHAGEFRSEGFVRFFTMLAEELDNEYLATVDEHLTELRFRRGVLMSAELGKGNKGVGYALHRLRQRSWLQRMTSSGPPSFGFEISERDEAGARALTELEGRGINLVANALAQSSDHVQSFSACCAPNSPSTSGA